MQDDTRANDDELVTQHTKKFQKELSSGLVSLVLLSILDQAKTALYGYEIAKQLQHQHDEKPGAIYPVLRNLHARQLIHCEVKTSDSGPPRKYYTITALGQKVLAKWLASWQATQHQVNNIINGQLHYDN
ncbi:PadR family transcriptional regulator [Rheinheimera pleomorphica]|uniref:PadR family transcriptional regulator n=1 Tax=Rheinheimera pleomorphica TaxID=2703963 RepID=UPI0014246011|nr:PadR family transcriptional regulator [Rheinheimera pleomorphica]